MIQQHEVGGVQVGAREDDGLHTRMPCVQLCAGHCALEEGQHAGLTKVPSSLEDHSFRLHARVVVAGETASEMLIGQKLITQV